MKEKILIVEDETVLSDAYKMILDSEGYNIKVANNGEEALRITEKFDPDLILLDLRMPKVDGLEFLRRYNLVEKHPKVKVVVFSNLDTQHDIDQAYELGAQKYMLKAWASPRELLKLVKDILSK